MSIKSNAEVIRDETTAGANTAPRVGGNLVEVADDLITKQTAINLNTAKETYTEAKVSANVSVVANTAKVGYTEAAVSANTDVAANTAKVSDINHVTLELPNADNTSDVNKPVSNATQAALDLKADEIILTKGMDAYTHAKRVNGLGGETTDIIPLDEKIRSVRRRASFLMSPNSFGVGKVFSQLPDSSVGDFDFSRASTATRVNKYGLIETVASNVPRIDFSDGNEGSLLTEPQSTNLVQYSEDFTEWQDVNISTEVSNILSPDGVSFFTKATFTPSVNSYVRQNLTMNAGSITASVFVKKGLIDSFSKIRIDSVDNPIIVWFNLDNGTVSNSTGSPTNTSIINYGNGVYRISASTTSTTDLSVRIFLQSSSKITMQSASS